MNKRNCIIIFLIFLNAIGQAFSQSKLDGKYIGLEEICWVDSIGKKHCYGEELNEEKWYHENLLTIKADSIFIEKNPVSIKKKKKFYSASDGGYYYYAGKISMRDSFGYATLIMISCDYCPHPVKFNKESKKYDDVKNEPETNIFLIQDDGILFQNVLYKRKLN